MTAADRPSVTQVGDTITTAEQLDALPPGSILRDHVTGTVGIVLDDTDEHGLYRVEFAGSGTARTNRLVVLYVPGEQPRLPVTDGASAEHTITYRHDRGTITADFRCHAAEDADCRLYCQDVDCEEWYIERDDSGPFHTREEEDDETGELHEARHRLVPSGTCNACNWIGEWDIHEAGPSETFDIATIPVTPEWDGDDYTWKRAERAAGLAETTCEHGGDLIRKFDGGRSAILCDHCRLILGYMPPEVRAETTTVHLEDPTSGDSYCGEPVTVITEAGDTRPVCQACHRGAMKTVRSGWCPCVSGRPQDCSPEKWPLSVCHGRAETTTATVEWGVRSDDDLDYIEPCHDEEDARTVACPNTGVTIVRREVTPWTEVPR